MEPKVVSSRPRSTSLMPGERALLDLFKSQLAPEWEIYVQPFLNGLRPDFVLLNPNVGVAVFEVKDWQPDVRSYRVTQNRRILVADGGGTEEVLEDPVGKIRLYRDELFNLYCPRLQRPAGVAAVTAGLVFARAKESSIRPLLGKLRHPADPAAAQRYQPVSFAEQLQEMDIDTIFPEWQRRSSCLMDEDTAEDLRSWMREPLHAREARAPLVLDSHQRQLATTRTKTGYRRVKGPAGSGKSMVLAARAVEIARTGRSVLVTSYNITLINYLRGLAARYQASERELRQDDTSPLDLTFLNFHLWCKRVCLQAGRGEEYLDLWRDGGQGNEPHDIGEPLDGESSTAEDLDEESLRHIVEEMLPQLVRRIYQSGNSVPLWDAILVDEGQDYLPEWWDVLRLALRPGGEMVLAADKTQNVYGTAQAWTDKRMSGMGFSGDWSSLAYAYRMPVGLMPLVQTFATTFLTGAELDLPTPPPEWAQMELAGLYPLACEWVHVSDPQRLAVVSALEILRVMAVLPQSLGQSDLCFVCASTAVGREISQVLQSKRVRVLQTFSKEERGQREKRAFFLKSGRIKGTTIHSFKGWEAPALVVCIQDVRTIEDRALLYTALTRTLRNAGGSVLRVVSSSPELRAYGRTWPTYRVELG